MRAVGMVVGVLACLCGANSASAASLEADYQLDGDRSSSFAGAGAVTVLGTGGGFSTETVAGDVREVFAFRRGGGLSLAAGRLVRRRDFSVAMVVRLAELDGFRRVLDTTGGRSDNGLYNFYGRAVLYDDGPVATSRREVFGATAHVVLTSSAAPSGSQDVVVYVGGRRVAKARVSSFALASGAIRLFKDNAKGIGAGEESAGVVDCILLYDGALNARGAKRVASRSKRCPAPERGLKQPSAVIRGEPNTTQAVTAIEVRTGLAVRCPRTGGPCMATASVDEISSTGRRQGRLGIARVSVAPGSSTDLVVPLTADTVTRLRSEKRLRVGLGATIATARGQKARARTTGRIQLPPPFEPGSYVGATSQGLPVALEVGPTTVRAFYYRWRALCEDGQTHENGIILDEPTLISEGRFSYDRILTTGARAEVSGQLSGSTASGTLSRSGGSAFNTDCVARDITWQARLGGPGEGAGPLIGLAP